MVRLKMFLSQNTVEKMCRK